MKRGSVARNLEMFLLGEPGNIGIWLSSCAAAPDLAGGFCKTLILQNPEFWSGQISFLWKSSAMRVRPRLRESLR
jgi:hypothetical protein